MSDRSPDYSNIRTLDEELRVQRDRVNDPQRFEDQQKMHQDQVKFCKGLIRCCSWICTHKTICIVTVVITIAAITLFQELDLTSFIISLAVIGTLLAIACCFAKCCCREKKSEPENDQPTMTMRNEDTAPSLDENNSLINDNPLVRNNDSPPLSPQHVKNTLVLPHHLKLENSIYETQNI